MLRRCFFLPTISLFSLAVSQAVETVTTDQDATGAPGTTLREAIANADPGETVAFAPGVTGPILLNHLEGELVIDKDLVIDASSVSGGMTISGDDQIRVFHIMSGATVEFKNLTITEGRAPDGQDKVLLGETGGNGGGIFNEGTLTLQSCTVSNSTAGDGGDSEKSTGGSGGFGGGISSTGALAIYDSTISNNTSGTGGTGGISDTMVRRNGGAGGVGGGIYCSGDLTLVRSTVSGNVTGNGGVGQEDGGNGGRGGGIVCYNSVIISESTISGNRTGTGGTASGAGTGDGGDGGNGGGLISFDGANITITNSTISGNTTGGGGIGHTVGFTGKGGDGGGIHTADNTLVLENVTIHGNATGENDMVIGDDAGDGGGIFQTTTAAGSGADITVKNTVIAGNTVETGGSTPDWVLDTGTITRQGINFVGDNTSVESDFPAPAVAGEPNTNGDFVGTSANPFDPLLLPFANYGGPTCTHKPEPDSPLVDPVGGDTAPSLTTDQRGSLRHSGLTVDIGAVEFLFRAPVIRAPRKAKAKGAKAKFRANVVSVLNTTLTAKAKAGAKAKAKGSNGSYRVIVKKISRKRTRVILTATDSFGKRTVKPVKVLKK